MAVSALAVAPAVHFWPAALGRVWGRDGSVIEPDLRAAEQTADWSSRRPDAAAEVRIVRYDPNAVVQPSPQQTALAGIGAVRIVRRRAVTRGRV